MAARTFYYNSVLGEGELTGIRSTDVALDSDELNRIDTDAMNRVNSILLEIVGAVAADDLIPDLMDTDEVPTLDPEIARLAQLLSASFAWKRWEQFNQVMQSAEDRFQLPNSMKAANEAKAIVKRWMKTRAIVKADGTIRYLGTTAEGGPIVEGPMREGSLFDTIAYYDPKGRKKPPIQCNPYDEAT